MAEYTTRDIDIPEDAEVQDYLKYVLPEKLYLALKWAALLLLPLIAVFYQALAGIWGLPMPDEISQMCSILGLFIGALIGVSEFKALKSK